MSPRTHAYAKSANQTSRDVRNLANLSETASTSRVLNLSLIHAASASTPEYSDSPFFKNSLLNKSLLIKHTLRPSERALFNRPRRTATKIIMPFDAGDLRLGGRSIFVNQQGYESFLRSYFGGIDRAKNTDLLVLQHLDEIPSLDPFLVREHLARFGFRPAACYLKISPHDVQQMTGFANEEIQRLVMTAFGAGMEAAAVKLTSKILANDLDRELDPLRETFRMTREDFSEGMFSWRGFLYFKWRQAALQDEIRQVLQALSGYRPLGPSDEDTRHYLHEARPRLARKIFAALQTTRNTLKIYDDAYHALTQSANPGPFRKFLIEGPGMFFELGENIGTLGHICSFWTYRMGPKMRHLRLSPQDFADILVDFEDSLLPLDVPEVETTANDKILLAF